MAGDFNEPRACYWNSIHYTCIPKKYIYYSGKLRAPE